MSVLSQGVENIEVNKATGTWDSTITEALLTFRSLLAMYSKKYHDFSLVLCRQKSYCVIACTDYPRCYDTVTIFCKKSSC